MTSRRLSPCLARLPELRVLGLVVHRSKPILQEVRDVRLGGLERSFPEDDRRSPGSNPIVRATLLAFADPAERLVLQCLLTGGTTVLVVGSLLLVRFLDHPFGGGADSIRPTAMQLSISQFERYRWPTHHASNAPKAPHAQPLNTPCASASQPSSQLDDVKCCDDES